MEKEKNEEQLSLPTPEECVYHLSFWLEMCRAVGLNIARNNEVSQSLDDSKSEV